MWIDILCAAVVILLAADIVAVVTMWRVYGQLGALDEALSRAEARGREQALRLEMLDRIRDGQQLAEEAINTGTTLAREVHHGIANIPFSILENIPSTASRARVARKLHDSISDDIYAAIGSLNRGVGRQIRGEAQDAGKSKPRGQRDATKKSSPTSDD